MKQLLASAAACCSLLVLSLPATAGDNIENITVTASRTPTPVNDAGSAISLITTQDIERQNVITLADLLRDMPGLAVSQQGGTGTLAQVRVRGAEANQVLVLIDGVEANDIAQGSEFNSTHVLANDIQRVEVVRGPQSALWGADALAGVINVITDPGTHAPTGISASAGGGSHNTARACARANVDVGANYTGPQADNFFPPYPPYQERVQLPAFTLVHIGAQYELVQNLTLMAHIDNLLNKTHEDVYGFRGPGIGAYAGLKVRI